MRKKCNHMWKHTTSEASNLRGDACLWLFHKCEKCGMEASGILIGKLKKESGKK